jgi:hypothetical protein
VVQEVDSVTRSWLELPSHRSWLAGEADRLIDFAERSVHPGGGFAWQDDDGSPRLDRPIELWITTRMVHVLALAHIWGRPGAGPLVDHGLAALSGRLHDAEHGGWFSSVGPQGPVLTDKRAYDHAFVVLAASSALVARRPGAADLLTEALAVVDRRFWREDDGLVVHQPVFDRKSVVWLFVAWVIRLTHFRLVNAEWLDSRKLLESEGHPMNRAFSAAIGFFVDVGIAGMNDDFRVWV